MFNNFWAASDSSATGRKGAFASRTTNSCKSQCKRALLTCKFVQLTFRQRSTFNCSTKTTDPRHQHSRHCRRQLQASPAAWNASALNAEKLYDSQSAADVESCRLTRGLRCRSIASETSSFDWGRWRACRERWSMWQLDGISGWLTSL